MSITPCPASPQVLIEDNASPLPPIITEEQCETPEELKKLRTVVSDHDASPLNRGTAALLAARFYNRQVGDYRSAKRYYKAAMQLAPVNSVVRQTAKKASKRLIATRGQFKQQDAVLDRIRSNSYLPDPTQALEKQRIFQQNIATLKQLKQQHPEFDRLHEVAYTIGLNHLSLNQYRKAWQAFQKAQRIKPAIDLYQPVEKLQASAYETWTSNLIRTITRSALWLLWVGLIVAAVITKPWQWAGRKELLVGLMVMALWSTFYWLSHVFFTDATQAHELINRDGYYSTPLYLHHSYNSPGATPLFLLFGYGTITITGIYFYALMLSQLKNRVAATFSCFIISCMLGVLVTATFHHNHCREQSRFYVKGDRLRSKMTGHFSFRVSEPEPYLLTNPGAYEGIVLDSISDPYLAKWLEQYQ